MTTFQDINALTQNRATTFEFSSEDAERILIPNTIMETSVSTDGLKAKLEKLYEKETRLFLHGSTLSEYWRNKKIPQGLRMQKALSIGKSDELFVQKWGEILNKCSLDLMLHIIQHVTAEAREVKTLIQEHEEILQQKMGVAFSTFDQSMKASLQQYKEHLLVSKIKKYKRDTEDYIRNEVYDWQKKRTAADPGPALSASDPPGDAQLRTSAQAPSHGSRPPSGTASYQRGNRSRGHASTDEDYTCDSDSSDPSPPPPVPFLDTRRGRGRGRGKQSRGRGKNAGGGNGHQAYNRPWTRSNSKTR